MLSDDELPPLPEPAIERGTKLVPYEERFFRTAGLAAAAGYTNDLRAFYAKEQLREYGRACERAAYERAAQLCKEQAGTMSMFASSREAGIHNRAVRECATAIHTLGRQHD